MRIAPIHKRLKRELRENIGRYLAMFVIFVVMISIVSAFFVVSAGMVKSVAYMENEMLQEDGQFTVEEPLSEAQREHVQASGVTVHDMFYIDHSLYPEDGSDADTTLRYYQPRTDCNLTELLYGRMPQTAGEAALERVFAQQNNIEIGDTLDGFTVTGFVVFAEYSSLYENNTDTILNTKTFGILLVTPEAFDCLQGVKNHTYSYRTVIREELSKKEQTALASEILHSLLQDDAEVSSICPACDNQAISFLKEDMGSDAPMMEMLYYILLVVIAFVFTVLINHTVDSEAVTIGALLANGYRKSEICRHYLLLPTMITLFGSIIGNCLGYTVFVRYFYSIYANTYGLPTPVSELNVSALLRTTVIPLVTVLCINLIGILRKLSISPLGFLRHDLRHNRKKGAVRLPAFRFLTRFRIRIFLQNAGSYFILFIGIFFASFLLIFGLGLNPIFENYVQESTECILAKNQYILRMPVETAETASAQKMTVKMLSVYNADMDKHLEVTVYGLDTLYGETLGTDAVLFSENMMKKQSLTLSDSLVLRDEYTETEYVFRPTAEIEYAAGLAVFMPRVALNRLLGQEETYFNGYLSDHRLQIDEQYVARTITENDITKLATQMIDSLSGIIPILAVTAICIYFVLMYILTKLAIDKNARNISFMKVFGYRDKEIHKLYLRGGNIAVILSLLLSIPMEVAGLNLVMELMSQKLVIYINCNLSWQLYALVVLIGLSTYAIIAFILMKHVKKVPMAEALKTIE